MIMAPFLKTHGLRYRAQNLHFQDFSLWKKCASFGKLTNIPRVLVRCRLSPSGVSRKPEYQSARDAALLDFRRRSFRDPWMADDPAGLIAYYALVSLLEPGDDDFEAAFRFLRDLIARYLLEAIRFPSMPPLSGTAKFAITALPRKRDQSGHE